MHYGHMVFAIGDREVGVQREFVCIFMMHKLIKVGDKATGNLLHNNSH